ncbi:uncharacterized protein THITE_2124605 [Thermothielavioides terrestris NRRL 8126]|uniref:ABM domain-containing protein n=1 Tax=Thermothielavioides terrestris (strain ATCC 38088 / NRRL 8126) TaxID=578455 RepID=G2RG18_THETT|nr:uncharacterized protein THITE_2124605 [Thermothielavioides terrestris NRRL 8126]AEO71772.1 hypothetical protein THITE_2124605 [Thermothielavioides terrestris NRRL 8126]
MARTKRTPETYRLWRMRTTWTRFRLPRGQDWPNWSKPYPDEHLGPLAGVPGREEVWLGRKVEDPEHAALIVLWSTEEDLQKFLRSPAAAELLRDLPEHDAQDAFASGALLRDLSLGDATAEASSSSLPSSPSRFTTLQWDPPHKFQTQLEGRITVTILEVAYTGGTDHDGGAAEWLKARDRVFGRFVPKSCEDLLAAWPPMIMRRWTTWAVVVGPETAADSSSGASQQQADADEAGSKRGSGRAVWCEFRRWAGYCGATPKREEAAAEDPLTRESWAEAVAEVTPPVTAWQQERWDIRLAPRKKEKEDAGNPGPEERLEESGQGSQAQ